MMMGYDTSFSGELKFTKELKASELAELKKFLGEDCRDHPEWNASNLSYIDLELTDDFTGLRWAGSEKTYNLPEKVNVVIEGMQKKYPDFGLTGELLAQGEDVGDVWRLVVENNFASQQKIKPRSFSKEKVITCPHCNEEFTLEEDKNLVFVFSGFRDENLEERIWDAGYEVANNISKTTTHLIMKDISKDSSKKEKAENLGCKIWSIQELENFLKDK